jgi:uncharacterized RDD family membrane protein YckC
VNPKPGDWPTWWTPTGNDLAVYPNLSSVILLTSQYTGERLSQSSWYYAVNGQQTGPISFESLAALIRSGQVGPNDLVWTDGMTQWLAAGSVDQLKGLFPAAAPAGMAPPLSPTPMGYYGPQMEAPVVYAGFWLRFVAWILDALVTGVAGCFIGGCIGGAIGAAGGLRHGPGGPGLPIGAQLPIQLMNLVVGWLYFALMESGPWQATLGKKALGLVVTDLEGRRISFARATGRHFGKLLSALILLIGYIMAGLTERKQALHDMMASTLVVRRG